MADRMETLIFAGDDILNAKEEIENALSVLKYVTHDDNPNYDYLDESFQIVGRIDLAIEHLKRAKKNIIKSVLD